MCDGRFGFNAGEMETLARTGAPVTLVVFSNSVFGWVKAGQDSGFGKRYFSVDFSQTNHARVAEAFGLKEWRAEAPSQLRGAQAAALGPGGRKPVGVGTQAPVGRTRRWERVCKTGGRSGGGVSLKKQKETE